MGEDGKVLLRLETAVDRDTVAREWARTARRPPRRTDHWWALGIGAVAIVGWVATGPSLLWWAGLVAAGLFLVGELLERRAVSRRLAAIPAGQRRRIIEITEGDVTVTAEDGTRLAHAPWSEVDDVRRQGEHYTVVIRDRSFDVPLSSFSTELARGSFEALAARNDRPVRHG